MQDGTPLLAEAVDVSGGTLSLATTPLSVAVLPMRYVHRDGQRVDVAPAQPCPAILTPDESVLI